MTLQYFVTASDTGNRIPIEVDKSTPADLAATKESWQTDWTSEFIGDPALEKYTAKTENGEIVALGAYRETESSMFVYIEYIESHPESNPTLTIQKKYLGIGRMMIAFGIQLSIDSGKNGVVTFEAKTDELAKHYIRDPGLCQTVRRADHADACRQCGAFALQYVSFLKGGAPMDIEVKRMSPTAIEMLDQLSAVCKRFGVDYYAASQNQRDLLDSIALHEYQLKKAHEQGLKRSEVPPFLGLKRSDRSNDMPA